MRHEREWADFSVELYDDGSYEFLWVGSIYGTAPASNRILNEANLPLEKSAYEYLPGKWLYCYRLDSLSYLSHRLDNLGYRIERFWRPIEGRIILFLCGLGLGKTIPGEKISWYCLEGDRR